MPNDMPTTALLGWAYFFADFKLKLSPLRAGFCPDPVAPASEQMSDSGTKSEIFYFYNGQRTLKIHHGFPTTQGRNRF